MKTIIKLSKEEKLLEEKIFGEEWPTENKNNLNKYIKAAKTHQKKDKRINIRLSTADYQLVKDKANDEGLPYQSLISSLIHKFVKNQLLEKNQVKQVLQEMNN
jgi:predicted DNA binding CopG/RHH family protein